MPEAIPAGTPIDMRAAAGPNDVVPRMNERIARRLRAAGLDPVAVVALAAAALAEDLAGGVDVTTAATVPAEAGGEALFVTVIVTGTVPCAIAGLYENAPVLGSMVPTEAV